MQRDQLLRIRKETSPKLLELYKESAHLLSQYLPETPRDPEWARLTHFEKESRLRDWSNRLRQEREKLEHPDFSDIGEWL